MLCVHLCDLWIVDMKADMHVGILAAQNRESHDSQNREPTIARNFAARSKKNKSSRDF